MSARRAYDAARIEPPLRARPRRPSGLAVALAAELRPDDAAPRRAAALASRSEAPLREVLIAHGVATPERVLAAEARHWRTGVADLAATPPDPRLVDDHDPALLLRAGCVPLRRVAGTTIYASCRPELFARFAAAIDPGAHMMLAPEREVVAAIEAAAADRLATRAETLTAPEHSARSMSPARSAPVMGAMLGGATLWGLIEPRSLMLALTGWAVLAAVLAIGLRTLAAWAELTRPPRPVRPVGDTRLPVVSMLVPLLREEAIARHLVRRLGRVDYPRELLDVVLVVEAEDAVTLATLAAVDLPAHMRVVTVPPGGIRTKPRALNYALPHCRGSIVGVWDAEDMPAPDQIRQVVRRFAARGPEVACLQGRLDYYNARHNVLSRLFAIEYAAWFRVFLPGIERLGLPVPLGGTTLFLRRGAMESVGGWDAHNVTEDADLGVRLARHGYRTEVVDTVTLEEANSRPLPWIRQRSRWLKGYALTWAVHMRRPGRLWRELGPLGFLGVQAVFLATVSQFALAPLFWTFLAASFGAPHPLGGLVPAGVLHALTGLFVVSQAIDWAVAMAAVSGPRHRHLMVWVLAMPFYHTLATAAMWKALWEIAVSPFYWDKTAHGAFHRPEAEISRPPGPPSRRR